MAGVRRLLSFVAWLAGSLVLTGCNRSEAPPTPPSPITVSLAAGTEIPLMLMKQLESGVDDEGTEVPMVVTEDIKDAAGHTMVRRGAPAQGTVTWSRREGTFDGMMGRPARLKVRLLATTATDGQAVDLCADKDKVEEPYELNRANTGTKDASRQMDEIAKDDRNAEVLQAVTDLFDKGDARVLEQAETRQKLADMAQQLKMPDLQEVAQQGQTEQLKTLLQGLQKGTPLAGLSSVGGQGQMTLMALGELAHMAGSVADRIGKMTKGRNIKAYVGTPITGFVAKGVSLRVIP